jgi:hypothetical protein
LRAAQLLLRQLAGLIDPIALGDLAVAMQQAVDLVEVVLAERRDLPEVEDTLLVELLLVGLGDAADLLEVVLLALRLGKPFKRGGLLSGGSSLVSVGSLALTAAFFSFSRAQPRGLGACRS